MRRSENDSQEIPEEVREEVQQASQRLHRIGGDSMGIFKSSFEATLKGLDGESISSILEKLYGPKDKRK